MDILNQWIADYEEKQNDMDCENEELIDTSSNRYNH